MYTLVGIHGAPRSGTSWLGQIFNSHPNVAYRYQPFFSYAFRGRVDEHSGAGEMRRFFDDLLASDDSFVTQTGPARLARTEVEFDKRVATHLVYKEVRFHRLIKPVLAAVCEGRVIGIVRDPRAVLASWFEAPREFRPEWDYAEEWRHAERKNQGLDENWYGYERWKELAEMFLDLEQRFAGQFMIVRYEDLVADPNSAMRSLFDFCNLDWTRQTEGFVAESTSRDDGDPYGVHRTSSSQLGKWKTRLDPRISEAIVEDLQDTPLAVFLSN